MSKSQNLSYQLQNSNLILINLTFQYDSQISIYIKIILITVTFQYDSHISIYIKIILITGTFQYDSHISIYIKIIATASYLLIYATFHAIVQALFFIIG